MHFLVPILYIYSNEPIMDHITMNNVCLSLAENFGQRKALLNFQSAQIERYCWTGGPWRWQHSVSTRQSKQHHITQDFNPQHSCENHESWPPILLFTGNCWPKMTKIILGWEATVGAKSDAVLRKCVCVCVWRMVQKITQEVNNVKKEALWIKNLVWIRKTN